MRASHIWQPIWANGYSVLKLSPKHAGPNNLAMGIQVIAPGGYVREHSHTPNQEILFCFAGKGTIIVDGGAAPVCPGHDGLCRAGCQAQNHQ